VSRDRARISAVNGTVEVTNEVNGIGTPCLGLKALVSSTGTPTILDVGAAEELLGELLSFLNERGRR
jgi:hypothetical protein